MGVVERLSLETARSETLIAQEHRHRYEFAQRLCAGRRVLDLCCGSGYGSEILAARAQEVVGVDNDAATIDAATTTVARRSQNVSFELADAISFLAQDLCARFDLVVCFEGLEHLHGVEEAIALLSRAAQRGLQMVVSVPNSKLFGERNPFHVTDFGYDDALAMFAAFPDVLMLPQFLAEGSLICPPGAEQTEISLQLEDRNEPEYANHFIFCTNFPGDQIAQATDGRLHLAVAPVFNRFAEGIKHANAALARENARLARARLGKAGSAAASALVAVPRELADLAAERELWRERALLAETHVSELEARIAVAGAPRSDGRAHRGAGAHLQPAEAPFAADRLMAPRPGEDPNSWEQRYRRAAQHLIPWIEQTVPLAGKTILEYGCGNAAVSCAFAAHAERLIGVDIDAGGIEQAREQVRTRGIENIELELHPLESVLDAVRARRGEIDVFLCYAVLEHLSVSERLAVLRVAREVVKPDGVIIVCETPNRLIYFDHHTAQMPFFHLLPDELALEYFTHSRRADFRSAIGAARNENREAALQSIVRWGRGVSFHEFEVVFGDLSRHVIASNYDPVLLAERPFHPDEAILARYLERWRPDLPPVFSRYWLDLILVPDPVLRRPLWIRPWPLQSVGSRGVAYTASDSLRLADDDATVWVSLPHPTQRLLVGAQGPPGRLQLRARAENMLGPVVQGAVDAGITRFATFTLPEPAQRIALSADEACELVFVGYEE